MPQFQLDSAKTSMMLMVFSVKFDTALNLKVWHLALCSGSTVTSVVCGCTMVSSKKIMSVANMCAEIVQQIVIELCILMMCWSVCLCISIVWGHVWMQSFLFQIYGISAEGNSSTVTHQRSTYYSLSQTNGWPNGMILLYSEEEICKYRWDGLEQTNPIPPICLQTYLSGIQCIFTVRREEMAHSISFVCLENTTKKVVRILHPFNIIRVSCESKTVVRILHPFNIICVSCQSN